MGEVFTLKIRDVYFLEIAPKTHPHSHSLDASREIVVMIEFNVVIQCRNYILEYPCLRNEEHFSRIWERSTAQFDMVGYSSTYVRQPRSPVPIDYERRKAVVLESADWTLFLSEP